jgi:hypothetical protein
MKKISKGKKLAPKPSGDLRSPKSILAELKGIVVRLVQIQKIVGTGIFNVKVHHLAESDLKRMQGILDDFDTGLLSRVVDDFYYTLNVELDSRDIEPEEHTEELPSSYEAADEYDAGGDDA